MATSTSPAGFPLDPDCEHRRLEITKPVSTWDLLVRGIEELACQDCGKTGKRLAEFAKRGA